MRPKPIAGYPSRTAACLALKGKGMTNRQIAEQLGLRLVDVTALIACKVWRTREATRKESALHENGRTVVISTNVLDALAADAARRGITVNQLVRDLLGTIVDDCMVDNVLDDAADLSPQPQQVSA